MFWGKKKKTKEDFYTDFSKEINDQNKGSEIKDNILAVFTYLTDGILVFDKENKVFLVNPQAENFFGVGKEKLLGNHILNLSRFENVKPLITLLGGGIQECLKQALKIKENLIVEVSVISMAVRGIKIGSLVILHDVTKEKSIERMKSEFVTIAAHRLRTPASAVKWTTQTLLSGDLGEMTTQQKEAVEKTYQTNERMIKLINDLLNVTEIEEGKYLSKMTLSNIEDVVQSVIDDYRKMVDEKKLNVKIYKPDVALPKIMMDIEKMKIAVSNIIDNSVRYTSSDGSIKIHLGEKDKEITFHIADTGLGISESDKDKVFTKFFRGANMMKVETEGAGLGLYIAKNIIEAHGGRVWFESKQGKGSDFYFAIPIRQRFTQFVTKEFY